MPGWWRVAIPIVLVHTGGTTQVTLPVRFMLLSVFLASYSIGEIWLVRNVSSLV